MKHLYKLVLQVAAAAFFVASAQAQNTGTVSNHAVPIGKGAGVTGYGSAVPGAAGTVLRSTGASSDPAFSSVTTSDMAFTQSGTGAVATTIDAYLRGNIITPEMFGAHCNGSDDGPAIQRAITYAGTVNAASGGPRGGKVQLAPCRYTVVTPIVDSFGVEVHGANSVGSEILYAPVSNNTIAYRVRSAGNIIVGGGLYNLRFLSSETTLTKTAIEIEDTSRYVISNVSVQGLATSYWEGALSIGLRTRGREFTWVENFTSAADRAIVISDNPNSTIDSDWSTFRNLYLLTKGNNPNFEIESGVNFTHFSIDGISCVLGSYCVFNNDTTATQISQGLSIRNLGAEQGTSATAFSVFINRPAAGILYGLNLDGFQVWDVARYGIYLRNVRSPRLENVFYDGTGVCIDTDNSVRGLSWSSSTFIQCTLGSFLGQNKSWSDATPAGIVLPRNAVYASNADNPGHIAAGTNTTDSASAGQKGEYVESVVVSGSAVALTSGSNVNVTSISLTAGDWDLSAVVYHKPAATTSYTRYIGSISTTSLTLDLNPGRFADFSTPAIVTGGTTLNDALPPTRLSIGSTTTVYLIALGVFTASTSSAYGIIRARRVR